MYSSDPEWCNICWKHVGPLECMDCLQRQIGNRAEELLLKIFLFWKVDTWSYL